MSPLMVATALMFLPCTLSSILSLEPRIAGGINALFGEFPYMVSIHLKAVGDGFYCAGVLVSVRDVLTSASCVLNGSGARVPEELHLLMGTPFRANNTDAIEVEVEEIWVRDVRDLAVLKLKEKVPELKPVVLNEFVQQSQKQCILVGWGANDSDWNVVDHLQEVYMRIRVENCSPSVICASGEQTSSGACYRDLGSPLLCDGSLAGILGSNPQRCGGPVEFYSIRDKIDWIRSQTTRAGATGSHTVTFNRFIIQCLILISAKIYYS
ncbi:neutrophil elastase-like [Wyeomyia smithii]|uniref:neutrophil elastase-like n=1 Tax=Wyeomyia smithii TaxID=174621 RepID=UPI002467FEE3|nr:neutrophil elastase-like [Wyeomyia smithii]